MTNGSTVTCAMCSPLSCRDYNEVAFHRGESQRLKREVALFYSLSYSKAQLHSATKKLLKMRMQLWQFRLIPPDCEGRLTAFLPDCKNYSAGEAPQLILSMFLQKDSFCSFLVELVLLDKVYFSVVALTLNVLFINDFYVPGPHGQT